MRPTVRFLSNELIQKIIDEAREVLGTLGVEIHNPKVLDLLASHGAKVDAAKNHAWIPGSLIDRALSTAPRSFGLFDVTGSGAADYSGNKVHFTPGSAAINILDHATGELRRPTTKDYVDYSKIMKGLRFIAINSTAFIPGDVHEKISDSYRLFLSLLYCEKPVVTGAFTIESFDIMKEMQLAVRGSEKALSEKPLTVFSCCPTSPLKWSATTSQNLLDCAKYHIPVEFIAMPLSGFMAPVTLAGTVIQHTAETLSGVVIGQLASPGTPMLYGGSPAIFDVRYETTPMGAVETEMIDCAYSEVGKRLGMPTQAYIAFSDAKQLDAQAGLETAMGATLAALSGINSISGPGMLDFESSQSLEKLVLDNEICGMVLRLVKGIEPHEDFPSVPRFEELLSEKHLLISKHTRKYLREEFYLPGPVIDRANRARWKEEGGLSLADRAHVEVKRLLNEYEPSAIPADTAKELVKLMAGEASRHGMRVLPERN
ncbi:MAG TPA: trimethylamine methyltransferase family protein [Spirochaetota bacterium]|nr:trimethylamine methyltransferase family protein [Spirochaetota bacterium]